ncbi:hypothetical protein [Vibrio profundi]|uniref:hypothetical protein n=1 Tax=Vibrio profundi TaxID=1774960 RepID=UPI0037356B00
MFLYQAVLFSAAFHLMNPHTFDFYRVGVKCAETQTEVVLSIEYQDVPLISILTTRQNTLNISWQWRIATYINIEGFSCRNDHPQ